MKINTRHLFYFLATAIILSCFNQRCHAKARDVDGPPSLDNANSAMDAGEEARKIKRLVKLALYPNASEEIKKTLSDEIAIVEKNRKLREDVVKHLLQDDAVDSDPTLPRVIRITYKDGALRGVLFVQTDAERSAKPGHIAWAIDSKREKAGHGER